MDFLLENNSSMGGVEESGSSSDASAAHWVATPASLVSAGLCALIGVTVSVCNMYAHCRNYNQPRTQKYIVRILAVVPLYGLVSWLSLLVTALHDSEKHGPNDTPLYLEISRDVYESFVVYCFLVLILVGYCHGESNALLMLSHKPPLPHPFPVNLLLRPLTLNIVFLRRCKQLCIQFIIVKPLMAAISLLLILFDSYHSNVIWSYFLLVVYNTSYTLALYALLLFYMALKDDIQAYSPVTKFFAVKIVVFATYWQSLAVKVAPGVTKEEAEMWNDFILCVEMGVFALIHYLAFPWHEFTLAKLRKAKRERRLKQKKKKPRNRMKSAQRIAANMKKSTGQILGSTQKAVLRRFRKHDEFKLMQSTENGSSMQLSMLTDTDQMGMSVADTMSPLTPPIADASTTNLDDDSSALKANFVDFGTLDDVSAMETECDSKQSAQEKREIHSMEDEKTEATSAATKTKRVATVMEAYNEEKEEFEEENESGLDELFEIDFDESRDAYFDADLEGYEGVPDSLLPVHNTSLLSALRSVVSFQDVATDVYHHVMPQYHTYVLHDGSSGIGAAKHGRGAKGKGKKGTTRIVRTKSYVIGNIDRANATMEAASKRRRKRRTLRSMWRRRGKGKGKGKYEAKEMEANGTVVADVCDLRTEILTVNSNSSLGSDLMKGASDYQSDGVLPLDSASDGGFDISVSLKPQPSLGFNEYNEEHSVVPPTDGGSDSGEEIVSSADGDVLVDYEPESTSSQTPAVLSDSDTT